MSAQQYLNFRVLKALLKDLRGFGLNPSDWRLERINEAPNLPAQSNRSFQEHFSIRHRHDNAFRMSGQWAQSLCGRYQVQALRVSSL